MRKTFKLFLYVMAIAIGSTVNTSAIFAEQKPEDKIKFRQSGYTFMRWNMGIIKNQTIKNPESYRKEQVIAAANVIAAISESGLESLFTPDTKTGKGWKETRVKIDFFEKPDEVKMSFENFRIEAKKLSEISHTGEIEEIKVQFKQLLNSCSTCHKAFRAK